MITLVIDNPGCSGFFSCAPDGRYVYQLNFTVGKYNLASEFYCPADASPELLASFARATEARRALEELNKIYPTEMKVMAGSPKGIDGQRSFSMYETTWHQLLRQLEQAYELSERHRASLTLELISFLSQSKCVFLLAREGSDTSLKYAYCKGRIWSSRITLDEDQWLAMVKRNLDRETAVLSSLKTSCEPEQTRVISVEVRREVWRRDDGRCTNCGARGRLEFDHIVPVSMGGSNTARNVQLLCEPCNRIKGPTLG